MALLDHDESGSSRSDRRPRQAEPAAIPGFSGHTQPGNDNRPEGQGTACELDCLIGIVPEHLLLDAAKRALDLGVGADRVLIAAGMIDERAYLERLAQHCSIKIQTFTGLTRDDVLLDDCQLGYAGRIGMMPLRDGTDTVMVVAPQMLGARGLVALIARYPTLSSRFRVTLSGDMQDFLLHGIGDSLATDAVWSLARRNPALSAAPQGCASLRWTRGAIAIGLSVAAIGLTLLTSVGLWLCSQLLAAWFIAAIVLRCTAAFRPRRTPPPSHRIPDDELPVYSVIVALYREERSVPQLLRALDALDYPREKLDIILAVEADDLTTQFAIGRFVKMLNLRVIVAPNMGPRTKPKALNCALPFARGSVIAVFDAEDQPEPGQLRAALHALQSSGPDAACAQASLCIHNAADSLFTRMFAAEYAVQFDAVLPGLAAMKLPIPLGGTSNHFRADALRAVGGWDAWNVTEDADLGLRLARSGYGVVTFASTTLEEAPIRFHPWLKQRSRWMKGWMRLGQLEIYLMI